MTQDEDIKRLQAAHERLRRAATSLRTAIDALGEELADDSRGAWRDSGDMEAWLRD